MEEEVKKWLEKKKREMGKVSYEEEKPVEESKPEEEPEPKTEPEQSPALVESVAAPAVEEAKATEEPERFEGEIPVAKHIETQSKITSDMESIKMREVVPKTGMLTMKAKILIVLIVALVIFIVYWTFVFSPMLLVAE